MEALRCGSSEKFVLWGEETWKARHAKFYRLVMPLARPIRTTFVTESPIQTDDWLAA